MFTVPTRLVNPKQIATAVRKAEKALAPDVVSVRYRFGEDWTGVPSIFFSIVMSDETSEELRRLETANNVRWTIRREAKLHETDMNSYFSFRSASEQAKMKEEVWA